MSFSYLSEPNASSYCEPVLNGTDSANSLTDMMTKASTASKRGRKPTNSIPPNQKIALQREAARRHKERRERYITELERTASMLTAASNETTLLQQRLHELRSENESLKRLQTEWTIDNNQHILLRDPSLHPLFQTTDFKSLETIEKDLVDSSHMILKMEDVAQSIPVEPTPREFIEPHFVGARSMLRNMTCLAHRSEDIDILFECYIEYVMYCTKQVTVEECPTRYRQICQLQDQLVEACVSVEDQNDVQQLFVAIRMNYIDLPH